MNAWDARTNESPQARRAWEAYRDAGPTRTIPKAREAIGRPSGYDRVMEGWSSLHAWGARAAAWDAHLDQAVQARIKAREVDRRVRQANLGRAMQSVAGDGLRRLIEAKTPIKANEVARLADVGFKIESTAEGDASERVAIEGGLEVRVVNVKDLPDPRKE